MIERISWSKKQRQDMNLLMSVSLFHWKRLAWERTISFCNTEFLASPKALWTKRFFRPFINGLNFKRVFDTPRDVLRLLEALGPYTKVGPTYGP
ncbi:hypothetical protein TNCV_2274931 [Trichonephila clavipes]|nr:hypothetical protein TNCV_2274931 [Trichonephila clavipes]